METLEGTEGFASLSTVVGNPPRRLIWLIKTSKTGNQTINVYVSPVFIPKDQVTTWDTSHNIRKGKYMTFEKQKLENEDLYF